MRINQNIAAFNAYRNLNNTNGALSKSLEKLSSGFRINRAADDAAGLVRSESLRSEVGGTKVAIRNAQDGISFVQTAEGALEEVHTILQRVRDLAVGAASSTSDGTAEQAEVDQLVEELTAIGTRTKFAGDAIFADYSATGAAKTFQVGASEGDTLSYAEDVRIDVGGANGFLAVASGGLSVADLNLTTDSGAAAAITALDGFIGATSTVRSDLGATQNRLESVVRNLSVAAENLQAAESRVRDADMAEEMVTFTRNQILQQAGTSMLAQANQVPQSVLSLLR